MSGGERYEPGSRLPRPEEAMATEGAAPPAALAPTLYQRRKAAYPTVVWAAMALSVLSHWVLFGLAPSFTAVVPDMASSELLAIELPPEVEVPPPPGRIARPALPVVSTRLDLPDDMTIAPTLFSEFTVADLPPPPAPVVAEEAWTETPPFTPYTTAPQLRNAEEATRAILSNWPRTLREAGVGGTVLLWFFIDEKGRVMETRVAKGSGYESLDKAASDVATVLEFSPAYNRDMAARVWVQMPIVFTTKAR